ncbi:hypothetical protein [Phytobacter sp. RSE-02]|uniref:hypothetical protein n=1 Tax=Phytobacter sp. RSE-02 TaxID=3229229 RepID=UPI00339D61C9
MDSISKFIREYLPMEILKKLKSLDPYFSVAERIYKLLAFIVIFFGGSIAGVLARAAPFYKDIGLFGVFAIALIASLLLAATFYMFKRALLAGAQQKYYNNLLEVKSDVNPLAENFSDAIIHLVDLRLPVLEAQQNKTFRRCRLVGPLTIAILGCSIEHSNFSNCGDVIALPDIQELVHLNGALVFLNCSFYKCTFTEVTVITNQQSAKAFKENIPGINVIGLHV